MEQEWFTCSTDWYKAYIEQKHAVERLEVEIAAQGVIMADAAKAIKNRDDIIAELTMALEAMLKAFANREDATYMDTAACGGARMAIRNARKP